jgi:hypothetical protein
MEAMWLTMVLHNKDNILREGISPTIPVVELWLLALNITLDILHISLFQIKSV